MKPIDRLSPQAYPIYERAFTGLITYRDAVNAILSIQDRDYDARTRDEDVTAIVLLELDGHGFFISTESGRHYFDHSTKRLLATDSFPFEVYVNQTFGISRTSQLFKHLISEIDSEAYTWGRHADVHQLAHFQAESNTLYLNNFGGAMYRLDGDTVELLDNGTDDVLFTTEPEWTPYAYIPEYKGDDAIAKYLLEPGNFSESETNLHPRAQRLVLLFWLYSVLFGDWCTPRPILLVTGVKGSGKTTVLRNMLRFLFGPKADVGTLERGREDAFISVITRYPLAVFDNVDGRIRWLNDRLATAATGGLISRRKLYTTNDVVNYRPNCFLALTSRSPHFRRDDIADRLLVLHVDRITAFQREEVLRSAVDHHHDELWTELINDLNGIINHIKVHGLSTCETFRLADWASLGLTIAESQGFRDEFNGILLALSMQQSEFALEDDPLLEQLIIWLENPDNHNRIVDAATLFEELQIQASYKHTFWPYKSPKAFAKRLNNIWDNLDDLVVAHTEMDARRRRWYRFAPKEAGIQETMTI